MSKISFDIISLFPDFFESPLKQSLIKKAIEKKIIKVRHHDLRKFGIGKHNKVDDKPFGGGPGMVLRIDVLSEALEKITNSKKVSPYTILLDPTGNKFDQMMANYLAKKESIVLICGHYEGVDERFKVRVDEVVSVGDYILQGGETAALVLLDSISRLIPGYLGNPESTKHETFSPQKVGNKKGNLFDYPTYTKPNVFEGKSVPEILLSGNHQEIKKWRQDKSLEKTLSIRPDLVKS